jgi:hypothetical protein
VQTHLEIARRLGIIDAGSSGTMFTDADEVSRILRGFIRSLSER